MWRCSVFIFLFAGATLTAQQASWFVVLPDSVRWRGIVSNDRGDVYAYGDEEIKTGNDPVAGWSSRVRLKRFSATGEEISDVSINLPVSVNRFIFANNRFYFTGNAAFRDFTYDGIPYNCVGGFDGVVGCLSENGTVEWLRRIGGPGYDALNWLTFNADSTTIVCCGSMSGKVFSNGEYLGAFTDYNMFFCELGLDGEIRSAKGIDFVLDRVWQNTATQIYYSHNHDCYFVAGYREGDAENPDIPANPAGQYVFMIGNDFSLRWQRLILQHGPCAYGNYIHALCANSRSVCVGAFCSEKYGGTGSFAWLDPDDGSIMDTRTDRDRGYADIRSVGDVVYYVTTEDANIVPSPHFDIGYAVMRRIDDTGDNLVLKARGGWFRQMAFSANGMEFLFGAANSTSFQTGEKTYKIFNGEYFLIGIGEPVSAELSISAADAGFKVYPNPASGTFRLSGGNVAASGISFFDAGGHKLPVSVQSSGDELILSAGACPDGLYFIVVRSAEGTVCRKVTIRR